MMPQPRLTAWPNRRPAIYSSWARVYQLLIAAALALVSSFDPPPVFAQMQGSPPPRVDARASSDPAAAQAQHDGTPRFDAASRTRGLAWGWGHSWSPFFGKTRS